MRGKGWDVYRKSTACKFEAASFNRDVDACPGHGAQRRQVRRRPGPRRQGPAGSRGHCTTLRGGGHRRRVCVHVKNKAFNTSCAPARLGRVNAFDLIGNSEMDADRKQSLRHARHQDQHVCFYLSIYLSIHLSIYLSFHPSFHLYFGLHLCSEHHGR